MTQLVRDLMHPGLITCPPHTRLGEVAALLHRHHVHALIVADRDGPPLGIITDFDLLAGEWLSADPESLNVMRRLTAADLMSSPIESVEASLPVTSAVSILLEKEVSRLLVTENGQAVGVISVSDFVASLAQRVPPKRDRVGDVMSDAMLVCRENTPIYSAARAMTEAGYRSVLVVNEKGTAVGVVSGRSLLPFLKNGLDETLTVRDVMHIPITIDINASLREAADKMIRHHHHRLVVVDDANPENFPLGILSTFDIVAAMARPGSVWQT